MPDFRGRRAARALLQTLAVGAVFALAACGGNARAPVEDRSGGPPREVPVTTSQSQATYRVQTGDTLYSIAFRYGMDFRKVAAANAIPAPYTIYPGQELRLREAPLPAPAVTPPAPRPPAPATQSPPATTRAAPPVSPSATPAPAATGSAPYAGQKVGAWRWPASGRVTRGYSRNVHKGIDIGGKRGEPVLAAAAGQVVYAGTGIVGLGELLIIKHNDVYLSAYAHNDRLLVAEGEVVSAGQRIADKGSSGTDTVKLHFEIRKEGKPIDPQRLLPRR